MKYYYISSNKKKKKKLIVPLTSKDAEYQELIVGENDRQTLWKTAW